MSEFKRGDRVEAWTERAGWHPAIYLGPRNGESGQQWVSPDICPHAIYYVLSDQIRHPIKRVKVMMQDWVIVTGGDEVMCASHAAGHLENSLKAIGWEKSGPPTEREFEVPQ